MRLLELTMPLDHQWMPDQLFPSATRFALAPRRHDEQGFTLGIDTGTSLLMPAQFAAFRGTRRLDDIPTPELVLRDTAVIDVAIGPGQEIGKDVLAEALARADFREGDALLIRTGWGNGAPREPGHDEYMLDT